MKNDCMNTDVAVIGYGITGHSCASFLSKNNNNVSVFVSDLESVNKEETNKNLITFHQLNENSLFTQFALVVVSPGVDLKHPALIKAKQDDVELISEIELFARHNKAQVIAVTGSNGKSTVVDMLHKALLSSHVNAGLGGNIGTSAISLLEDDYSIIVLEISSFQLELTTSLEPKIATVLNVTEDHIDRHGDINNYAAIKRKIYDGADIVIVNRDDPMTKINGHQRVFSFGQTKSDLLTDSWFDKDGIWFGGECLIAGEQLKTHSSHNILNMQVVLIIGKQILEPAQFKTFIKSLMNYKGLPHRFEKFFESTNKKNVSISYIDDSKATNPGAAISAIESIDQGMKLILIVGGDSKKADLTELSYIIRKRVDLLLCMGQDADEFMPMCERSYKFDNLENVVEFANKQVEDIEEPAVVLLSPACASIDMFENYKQRGKEFQTYVERCA